MLRVNFHISVLLDKFSMRYIESGVRRLLDVLKIKLNLQKFLDFKGSMIF